MLITGPSPTPTPTSGSQPAAPAPTPTYSSPPTSSSANSGYGGGGGGGASNPFYTSDPGYLAALLAQHTGDSQIQQMLNEEIAKSIIGYGDPSLAKMAGFNLSNSAAAEARQNYLAGNSTLSRLDHSHDLARQSIVNQLAGRGLLFSGETGYQRGQADRAYGNNVYDAQQAVLNGILGFRQTAMQQEQGLQSQVISALENAYNNYLANGQYGSGPSTTTPASIVDQGGFSHTPGQAVFNQQPSYVGGQASFVHPAAAMAQPAANIGQQTNAMSVAAQLKNPYTTGKKRFG